MTEHLLSVAELARESADAEAFERGLLGVLERELGFDVGFVSRAGVIGPSQIGLEPGRLEAARAHWPDIGREMSRLRQLAADTGGVLVDEQRLGPALRRQAYHRHVMVPHRGTRTLLAFLDAPRGLRFTLGLGRRGAVPFADADQALVRGLSPVIALGLSAHDAGRETRLAPGLELLTPREREVLDRARLGHTNRQIGAALGTSAATVRNQLASVYAKLGVSGRAEAVGLLTSGG